MAAPITTTTIQIRKVFDVSSTYRYRVKGQLYADDPTTNAFSIRTANDDYSATTSMYLHPMTVVGQTWIGFDFETTLTTSDYRNMQISVTRSANVIGYAVYLKNFRVYKITKAEVQDSDILNAGRRRSFYEGTKMSSTDINVDSPDTIDGGPVITVNTVSPSTPSSNPIGTSVVVGNNTALEGRAIVNRSPSSNVS